MEEEDGEAGTSPRKGGRQLCLRPLAGVWECERDKGWGRGPPLGTWRSGNYRLAPLGPKGFPSLRLGFEVLRKPAL